MKVDPQGEALSRAIIPQGFPSESSIPLPRAAQARTGRETNAQPSREMMETIASGNPRVNVYKNAYQEH